MSSGSNMTFQSSAGDSGIPGTVPNNTWTHIVLSMAANGTLSIYKNGQLIDSFEPSVLTVPRSFQLGEVIFNTAFDDLKIYDCSLSAQQVFDLYNDVNPVVSTDPAMLYRFDFNYPFDATIGTGTFAFNTSEAIDNPFTVDRFGNANSAINLQNIGAKATLLGLPYGAAERSVSVWARLDTLRTLFNFCLQLWQ